MTKNNPSFVSHGDSSPTTSVRLEIDAFLAKMKGASTAQSGIRGRLSLPSMPRLAASQRGTPLVDCRPTCFAKRL